MTTTTAPEDTRPQPPSLDLNQTPKVSFGRLMSVEWRKMMDTRSGRWLLIVTALLLVAAAGITLLVVELNDGLSINATIIAQVMTIPLSLLLPVFAILTITSEWSQRTALVTFSLEPSRVRVVMAKLVSVIILALGTIAIAFAMGALLNVAAAGLAGTDPVWNLEWAELGATLGTQILFFLMAFGLGLLLLSTPAAVAIYYVVAMLLPFMVYQTLAAFFEWARDSIPWFDLTFATLPFTEPSIEIESQNYAQLAVATTIWVVIPLVLGIRRVLTTEPK